mmetsp:Transcript_34632/g.81162  ORF Transcript_34632/g.81162 Transcript_34632/m.81162 type:complete len:207 (+) Transcript_34632:178-798(+)
MGGLPRGGALPDPREGGGEGGPPRGVAAGAIACHGGGQLREGVGGGGLLEDGCPVLDPLGVRGGVGGAAPRRRLAEALSDALEGGGLRGDVTCTEKCVGAVPRGVVPPPGAILPPLARPRVVVLARPVAGPVARFPGEAVRRGVGAVCIPSRRVALPQGGNLCHIIVPRHPLALLARPGAGPPLVRVGGARGEGDKVEVCERACRG